MGGLGRETGIVTMRHASTHLLVPPTALHTRTTETPLAPWHICTIKTHIFYCILTSNRESWPWRSFGGPAGPLSHLLQPWSWWVSLQTVLLQRF